MQNATSSFAQFFAESNVKFLPLIDLNPNSMSCIYSTLKYIVDQAKKAQVNHTPCITFDQPLYKKAMEIVTAETIPVVCRLGGFHQFMSFLGSIGNMMKGSGLEEAFEEIYASNSVGPMMCGKKIARAIRAHLLMYSALTSLLLEKVYDENNAFADYRMMYDRMMNRELEAHEIEEALSSKTFKLFSRSLNSVKKKPLKKSRTASLWLNYMRYIEVVQDFITAERTSNWDLHLCATSKMLNLFAATGHGNYAKSTRVYLQEMLKLEETHPELYKIFKQGRPQLRIQHITGQGFRPIFASSKR